MPPLDLPSTPLCKKFIFFLFSLLFSPSFIYPFSATRTKERASLLIIGFSFSLIVVTYRYLRILRVSLHPSFLLFGIMFYLDRTLSFSFLISEQPRGGVPVSLSSYSCNVS
jgi:hypothetical protein